MGYLLQIMCLMKTKHFSRVNSCNFTGSKESLKKMLFPLKVNCQLAEENACNSFLLQGGVSTVISVLGYLCLIQKQKLSCLHPVTLEVDWSLNLTNWLPMTNFILNAKNKQKPPFNNNALWNGHFVYVDRILMILQAFFFSVSSFLMALTKSKFFVYST